MGEKGKKEAFVKHKNGHFLILLSLLPFWGVFGLMVLAPQTSTGQDRTRIAAFIHAPEPLIWRKSRISGADIPRFVSIKANKANIRTGPSTQHTIAWVFQRRYLPVEIIAETSGWRKIRDYDGETGWIWRQLLSGKRTIRVMGAVRDDDLVDLLTTPDQTGVALAKIESGAIGEILACRDNWCRIDFSQYQGWLPKRILWGVYQDEIFP